VAAKKDRRLEGVSEGKKKGCVGIKRGGGLPAAINTEALISSMNKEKKVGESYRHRKEEPLLLTIRWTEEKGKLHLEECRTHQLHFL